MDIESQRREQESDHRHLTTRETVRAAIVDLVTVAQHEILICAPQLEAAFYNRADVAQALGHFIARRTGNRIRILVEDSELLLQADVRLVELTRRFSDLILIRQLGELHQGLAEMFIVVDAQSCLHQRDIGAVDATYDFHAAQLAMPLARRFETLWAASDLLPGLHPFRL